MKETPKETLVCSNPECRKPIQNWTFAFWVGRKPHCSIHCALKTKDKTEKVDRWTQKA